MTAKSPKTKENSFGSFALGVSIGVGAALLFGTDEGRKLAKSLFDSLPENIKNLKSEPILGALDSTLHQEPYVSRNQTASIGYLSEPESTPHHATYEAPPPPAPYVEPRIVSLENKTY